MEFEKKTDVILCYLTKLPQALAIYTIELLAQTVVKKLEIFVYSFKNGRFLGAGFPPPPSTPLDKILRATILADMHMVSL